MRKFKYSHIRFLAGNLTDYECTSGIRNAVVHNEEKILHINTEWVGGQPLIIMVTATPGRDDHDRAE